MIVAETMAEMMMTPLGTSSELGVVEYRLSEPVGLLAETMISEGGGFLASVEAAVDGVGVAPVHSGQVHSDGCEEQRRRMGSNVWPSGHGHWLHFSPTHLK